MENIDYEKILDALPETAAYVIRESDRALLYFNRRVRRQFPDARLGEDCRRAGAGLCARCPIQQAGETGESRAVAYSEPYGGVVDITATRTLWEGDTPAFIVIVTPRMEVASYVYRKIFHVDLTGDRCCVLKAEPGGWQPGDSLLSPQLEEFAKSGAVHPEDQERFIAFTRMENLRSIPQKGRGPLSLLYRRQAAGSYRWNLMEVIPDQSGPDMVSSALLCVKDVHDVFWEGVERENVGVRSRELVRSLGEQNFSIYSIHLDTGVTDPIRVEGQMRGGAAPLALPWEPLMRVHIMDHLQESCRDEFERRFSLEGLRQARAEGLEKAEMLCQRLCGGDCRYISVTAHFSQERNAGDYAVLALQDVDERMRQDASRLQALEDRAEIISSLSSLFFSTYYIDVDSDSFRAVIQLRRVEDVLGEEVNFTAAQHIYANHFVHPDDREEYLRVMNVRNLRETLRWWQPCLALEYRKLPDDPSAQREDYAWVRATAVLARTGPDDMPKTVVYVAQDISNNRRGDGRDAV